MMKDRLLKLRLLKYYLLNFWYPELEVNIKSKERLSNAPKLITDIDALALFPDVTGNLRLYLGDCKTLKKSISYCTCSMDERLTRISWS